MSNNPISGKAQSAARRREGRSALVLLVVLVARSGHLQDVFLQVRKAQHHMAATPTSKPILHAISPRIAVGNAKQTQAFYGRIGFACTHQEEGFMIVERDGVQLHLHPSNEPSTGHGAFWIRVSNIEALFQEYLAANVITSSKVKAQRWGFKEFHICDPFRNIFIFAESLTNEDGSAEQAR
jgi:hypothetical protein